MQDNDKTLEDLSLVNNSVLFAVKALDSNLETGHKPAEANSQSLDRITVKTNSGKVYELTNLSVTLTVDELKKKICAQDSTLTADGIKLIFKGKPISVSYPFY